MAAVFQTTQVTAFLPTTFPQDCPQIFGGNNNVGAQWVGIGSTNFSGIMYIYADSFDSVEHGAFNTTANSSLPHYLVGYYDGTNLGISVDGGAFTTQAASANTLGGDAVCIGGICGASTAQNLTATVGELIIWNRVLTGGEISSVNTFFHNTWGI
jgi:hypothetical protein